MRENAPHESPGGPTNYRFFILRWQVLFMTSGGRKPFEIILLILLVVISTAPVVSATSHTGQATGATITESTESASPEAPEPACTLGTVVRSDGTKECITSAEDRPTLGAVALPAAGQAYSTTPITISAEQVSAEGTVILPIWGAAVIGQVPTAATTEPISVVLVDIRSAQEGVVGLSTTPAVYDPETKEIAESASGLPAVDVTTKAEIVYSGDRLAVATPAGEKELAILPHEIPGIASEVASITSAELKVSEDVPIYEVSGTTPAMLLGIIPVTLTVSQEIDATTGEIVSVEKPFWSILTTPV